MEIFAILKAAEQLPHVRMNGPLSFLVMPYCYAHHVLYENNQKQDGPMLNLIKKAAIYILVILGIIYGYQLMTGKSITSFPREIVDKLQQKDTRTESANPHYYRDPAKNIPQQ